MIKNLRVIEFIKDINFIFLIFLLILNLSCSNIKKYSKKIIIQTDVTSDLKESKRLQNFIFSSQLVRQKLLYSEIKITLDVSIDLFKLIKKSKKNIQ